MIHTDYKGSNRCRINLHNPLHVTQVMHFFCSVAIFIPRMNHQRDPYAEVPTLRAKGKHGFVCKQRVEKKRRDN